MGRRAALLALLLLCFLGIGEAMEQQPLTVEAALAMIREGAEGTQLQAIVDWLRTQGGMPDFEPHHVHDQAALYAQAQAQAFAAGVTPSATPHGNAPMDMGGFLRLRTAANLISQRPVRYLLSHQWDRRRRVPPRTRTTIFLIRHSKRDRPTLTSNSLW